MYMRICLNTNIYISISLSFALAAKVNRSLIITTRIEEEEEEEEEPIAKNSGCVEIATLEIIIDILNY